MTPAGEIFVDLIDGFGHSQLKQAPLWTRKLGPEYQELLTTYTLPRDVPVEMLRHFGFSGVQESFALPYWAQKIPVGDTTHITTVSVWGWPAPCLGGVERMYRVDPPGAPRAAYRWETQSYFDATSHTSGRIRKLPTGVLGPGLAVNAVVWAAILLLPVFAVRSCRGWARRRRGACARCGYSREGLDAAAACPECGDKIRVT